MNYRLGVWGFLQSPQILAEGSSNAGLLDQRLALRWVQENIGFFGGDKDRVTVWGESAGAQSIGLHLHSYGGRNDNLFQAAILESGGPVGAFLQGLAYYGSPVENLTRTVGCWTASDQLSCLRNLSSEELFAAQTSQTWNPIVDGDFLTDYPSSLMPTGSFIKVPLLVGANTDEGVSFSIKGLDTEAQLFHALFNWRQYELSPATIRKLLDLYPNDPAVEPPYHITDNTTFPKYGLEWRRSAAIGGDLVMIGQRRKVCEFYTKAGQEVYSYRFDTPLWNAAPTDGVKHFVNVVFSFQNISGQLGPLPQYQSYKDLSRQIGEYYVHFVNAYNPNGKSIPRRSGVANLTLLSWPKYELDSPKNMVLNSNGTFVEDDTWRKEGIAYINTIDRELGA
jgi:carboxylesterase type B